MNTFTYEPVTEITPLPFYKDGEQLFYIPDDGGDACLGLPNPTEGMDLGDYVLCKRVQADPLTRIADALERIAARLDNGVPVENVTGGYR